MRDSMVRMREVHTPSTLDALHDELKAAQVDVARYSGAIADAAFELEVERALVARIAWACAQGVVPGYGSRLVLEHAPLEETAWRLCDGTLVELFDEPEIFVRARLLERVRAACRNYLAAKAAEPVPQRHVG